MKKVRSGRSWRLDDAAYTASRLGLVFIYDYEDDGEPQVGASLTEKGDKYLRNNA